MSSELVGTELSPLTEPTALQTYLLMQVENLKDAVANQNRVIEQLRKDCLSLRQAVVCEEDR